MAYSCELTKTTELIELSVFQSTVMYGGLVTSQSFFEKQKTITGSKFFSTNSRTIEAREARGESETTGYEPLDLDAFYLVEI